MMHSDSRLTAIEAVQGEPTEEFATDAQVEEGSSQKPLDNLRQQVPSLAVLASGFFASGLGDVMTRVIGEVGGHKGA